MESIDLSHWNTVEHLGAEQLVALAVGVDPYSNQHATSTQLAKQKMLRGHLCEAHLRAANWAFAAVQRIAADELAMSVLRRDPIPLGIPADGHSPLPEKWANLSIHAGKIGLLPSEELRFAFEAAFWDGYIPETIDRLCNFEGTVLVDAMFERDAIHEWLNFLGWQSAYNFAPWRDESAAKATEKSADSNSQKARWPWGNYETNLLKLLPLVYEEHWQKYDPARPTTAPKSEVVVDWLVATHKAPRRVAEVIAQLFRADAIPNGPRREAK